jgi:hypothetical protein
MFRNGRNGNEGMSEGEQCRNDGTIEVHSSLNGIPENWEEIDAG